MEMQREHGGITRRSFVGASAAAMAGLALVGCQPENKLEKTEGEPDRLRAALAEVDPTDYEKLVAAQKAVDDAVAAREALEDEWL